MRFEVDRAPASCPACGGISLAGWRSAAEQVRGFPDASELSTT